MNKNRILLTFAAPALLTFSCHENSDNSGMEKDRIKATWSEFITHWEQLDASGCAAFYTDDCIHVPPGFPANYGPTAVEAFYTSLFESTSEARYSHKTEHITVSGNVAVELGAFQAQWLSKDSTTWNFNARCMAHWVKNAHGQWKIKAFVYNLPPGEM